MLYYSVKLHTCVVSSWRSMGSLNVSFTSSKLNVFGRQSLASWSKQSSSSRSKGSIWPRQSSSFESFSTLSAAAIRWLLSSVRLTWRIDTELAWVIMPRFLAMFNPRSLTLRFEMSSSCSWLTWYSGRSHVPQVAVIWMFA